MGPQFLNQGLNSYWKHGVFFFFLIYLIIWGYAESLSLLWLFSSWDESGLPSSCSEGFSLMWLLLLQSMGPRARGLSIAAPRLNSCAHRLLCLCCSEACGIFSDQGSNPYLLHWEVDSLLLSHQGSPAQCLNHWTTR